jgi:diguanylate cyclase (GGDEF)-like protein
MGTSIDKLWGDDTTTTATPDSTSTPRSTAAPKKRGAFDDLWEADSTPAPSAAPTGPAAPTIDKPNPPRAVYSGGKLIEENGKPVAGRGIFDALGDAYGESLRRQTERTEAERAAMPLPPVEHRRPAYVADRRTQADRDADQRAETAARAERLATNTRFAQTGAMGGGMGGYVTTPQDVSDRQQDGEARRRFSPEGWRDVARRGMDYAGKLNAQAVQLRDQGQADAAERLHQQAEDMSRKAYNAQLLADGAAQADTFGAIALSNLLGVVHDPYAGQRRNMAELRANPRLTPTALEQTALLGKNLPVSTEREGDPMKDLVAPLAGSAPLFVAGGVAGRAALGALGERAAGSEAWEAAQAARRGGSLADIMGPTPKLRGVAGVADVLGAHFETTPLVGPKQAGLAGVREAGESLVENLPALLKRGATEGQVIGAVQAARMAQQEGEDPVQAAAMATMGNLVMGPASEVLGGGAARLLGVADRSVSGAADRVLQRLKYRRGAVEPTTPVGPQSLSALDQGADVAGKTPVSGKTLEGQRVDLATAMETMLAAKRTSERARAGEPLRSTADIASERAAAIPDTPRDVGPPLRTAYDVAADRLPAQQRAAEQSALERANATVQLQRAKDEAAAIAAQQAQEAAQLRVETARLQQMGPPTMAEALTHAAREREAGEPLAADYHDAINAMADQQARMQDATVDGKSPSAKLQLDYARARSRLNEMRQKYGTQIGAAALVAASHNDDDLSDEEKKWIGLAGGAVLATRAVDREAAEHALTSRSKVGAGKPPRLYNFELHTAHDLNMARVGELHPEQQHEMIHALTKTVVEPVLESEGIHGARTEPGMGGWFGEGHLSAQPSITLHLPAGLTDQQAQRIAARISKTMKQSAFYDVKPKDGGGSVAAYFDFGREVTDEEFRDFMRDVAENRDQWNGFTRTTNEQGNTIAQIVFDKGAPDEVTRTEAERIIAALDDRGYTGGTHDAHEVQAREFGSAQYDALVERGGRPAAHSRADGLAQNSYEAVARHVAIEANNAKYRTLFEEGNPTEEYVVPSVMMRKTGTSYIGANHMEAAGAAKKAGETMRADFSRPEGQQTPYLDGFDAINEKTGERRFVTRAEADAILRYNADPQLRKAMEPFVDAEGNPKANARSEDLRGAPVTYRDLYAQVPEALRGPHTPGEEEPFAAMATTGGKVGAGFDPSLIQKLGANMYKGNLGVVALKEGIQNAIDAVRAHGSGEVQVQYYPSSKTLSVHDTGGGMSPEQMSSVFVDIGGSGKDALESSGGYGLAKVALFAKSKEIDAVSVWRNPQGQLVETVLRGSGEDWATHNMDMDSRVLHDEYTSTGTTVTLGFDDDVEPDTYGMQDYAKAFTENSQLAHNVTIHTGLHEHSTANRHELTGAGEPIERFQVPGANIEVHETVARKEPSDWDQGRLDVQVLNRGVYQFTTHKYLENGTGLPKSIIVDVHPSVSIDDPNYPFTTSREELKKAAGEKVEAFLKTVSNSAARREVENMNEALVRAPKMVDAATGETTPYRVVADHPGFNPQVLGKVANDQHLVTIADHLAETLGTMMQQMRRRLPPAQFAGVGVSKGWLGVNYAVSHLAQMAEKAGADVEFHRGSPNQIYWNPFTTHAEILSQLRNEHRLTHGSLDTWNEMKPEVQRELATRMAEQTWATMVHELAHQGSRGHNESFAGVLTRLEGDLSRHAGRHIDALEPLMQEMYRGYHFTDLYDEVEREWNQSPEAKSLLDKIGGHQQPEGAVTSAAADAGRAGRAGDSFNGDESVVNASELAGDRGGIAPTPYERERAVRGGADVGRGGAGIGDATDRRVAGRAAIGAVAALLAGSDQAGAETEKHSPGSLYATHAGAMAAGALIALMAGSKKLRAMVRENRELNRALHLDELAGLSNKRALARAIESVDRDDALGWIVLDGNRFKAMNDAHGHPEGDKAIAHFGKAIREAAEQVGVPMRGFRAGGDEFAFAAPKSHIAEVLRTIEENSPYTKGEVTTSLTGAFGNTYDEADAMLGATKEANRRADPSLRREMTIPASMRGHLSPEMRDALDAHEAVQRGEEPPKPSEGGVTLYANPVGPALRELRRAPSAAALATLGYTLDQNDDNPMIQRTGKGLIGLAALNAIGSRRLGAGKDFLAEKLIQQLRKTRTGTNTVRAFNPDALLSPEVRRAIIMYERARTKATGMASRLAAKAKALGPEGDRAVSDVLDNEQWEGIAAQTPEVLAVALDYADEYEKMTQAQLKAGTLDPSDVLPNYGGPRKYAHYEVARALADKPGARGAPSIDPRIAKTQTRTLDIPIREAQAKLAEAYTTGDPKAIRAAQDDLDYAELEQQGKRVERGEIREASYRAAAGIEKGYQNVAAAQLFETLRTTPGVAHPEWVKAIDEFQTARQLRKAAVTQADKDAADLLVNNAAADLKHLRDRFSQKGQDYVSLPDSPAYGMLRGAVVQRDVAHGLEGFGKPDLYGKLLQQWKEMKTVFNPGTSVGNIMSNFVALHMGDVPLWLQPKYFHAALADLKANGEAARALTDAGVMHINATNADGMGGTTSSSMRSAEGLEQLLGTTRSETADVIRRESQANSEYAITEPAIAQRARDRLKKGALVGGVIGAAKGFATDDDDSHPGRVPLGAAIGASLGALAASGKGDIIRKVYGHQDNLARIAIFLRRRALGDTPEQALEKSIEGLGNFRTRSPAIRLAQRTVSPFLLYQAKAVPAFTKSVIDHPWKYVSLIAAFAALNEYSKREVGEVPEEDRDERDRATWGYLFPGFTQLPITDAEGNKGATDVARYTPFGGLATGAPPGTVPDAFSSNAPQVASPGGPALDLAARALNVHPMTKRPLFSRDLPLRDNIQTALREGTDFVLPSGAGYHTTQIVRDYDNRDWAKLQNDLLGPLGSKPRFVRPGAASDAADYEYDRTLRDLRFQLERDLEATKDTARANRLIERELAREDQAFENNMRRVNPPAKGTRP